MESEHFFVAAALHKKVTNVSESNILSDKHMHVKEREEFIFRI